MRNVVITGAGSGIGRAIATTLAERGWRVIATDLDGHAALETVTGLEPVGEEGHVAQELDVTDAAAVARVAGQCVADGGLDAWVSNAGISFMDRFVDMPLSRVEATIRVNLLGVYICGQAAARAFIAQGRGGRIVHTASMAGKQGRVPFLADYVASKFGVIGLTQAMAFELAEHAIAVNAVCPGFVETPMQSREVAWEAELRGVTPHEVVRSWIADTPLGRLQRPDDVARAVAFLLSEDAVFITGEAIAVNGGAYMD